MTHRRAFIRTVGGAFGASAAASLLAVDTALGRTFRSLDDVSRLEVLGGGDAPRDGFARQIREEYLLGPDVTYLNHASIGTIPRVVLDAHKAYLSVCETNPWLYMWGGVWEEPREAVRAKAAAALGCAAEDVAITHNTTEGFSLLAQGLPLGPGDEVLHSSVNHDGASVCFHHHAPAKGYRVRVFDFPLERVGELTPDELVRLHVEQIRPDTRVLVFPHVDNILGVRYPLKALAKAAHERGVEFVAADGAQTVGALPLEVADSGIDFYAASPHKWVQAPKGLGLLYARRASRADLRAMWVTWGQERWAGTIRTLEDYGTRDLPAVLALGDALDFQAAIGYDAKERRHRYLFEWLKTRAAATRGFAWASASSWDLGGPLVGISIDGMPAPEFASRMGERGFFFRPFTTRGLNSVRISPNLMTSEAELERFFEEGSRVLAGR